MPDSLPPLVSLWKDRERVDDEPLYALEWAGIEWRDCILSCNHKTQNADGICDHHDVFGNRTDRDGGMVNADAVREGPYREPEQ